MQMQENKSLVRFKKRTYLVATQILVAFLGTGIIGLFVGKAIDEQFDSKPKGALISLLIAYLVSWIIVSRLKITSYLGNSTHKPHTS